MQCKKLQFGSCQAPPADGATSLEYKDFPLTDSPAKPITPAAWALFFLCISFVGVTILLNYPYRPFPTDDIWGYNIALTTADWWKSDNDMLMNSPVHPACLYLLSRLVGLTSLHWFQTLLFVTVLSLAGTAMLIGLTVQTVTKDLFYTVSAAGLFLCSAWSQTYVHFYTYAPLSSFFMTASLFCFVKYYVEDTGRRWYPLASGILIGIFFLSSSSAKLLAGILFCMYLLLMFRLSPKEGKKFCMVTVVLGTAVPVIGFMPFYLGPLVQHLYANVYAGNAAHFAEVYGVIPKTPFFSFFRLMWVYSPVMLVFLTISICWAVIKWKSLKADKCGILVLTLMATLVAHCVMLDLLPFTKLGRTQFPLLPVVILSLALLYSSLPKKRVAKPLFVLFLSASLLLDAYTSITTREVRRDAPAKLKELPADTLYFVVEEDPHSPFLQDWLSYDSGEINRVAVSALPRAFETIPRSIPVALVLGPMGTGSGRSILQNGTMNDFADFALPSVINAATRHQVMYLPYYAYYPLFLMEEENCQFLYFNNHVPEEHSGRDRLTVYYWPPVKE